MKTHTEVAPGLQRESEAAVSHRSLAPGPGKVLAAHLLASGEGQPAEGRSQKRRGKGWLSAPGWEGAAAPASGGCWC